MKRNLVRVVYPAQVKQQSVKNRQTDKQTGGQTERPTNIKNSNRNANTNVKKTLYEAFKFKKRRKHSRRS